MSEYLDCALARCRLPIGVSIGRDFRGHFFAIQDRRIRAVPLRDIVKLWNAGWPHLTGDPRDAKAAYLRLCDTLSRSAARSDSVSPAVSGGSPLPEDSLGASPAAERFIPGAAR